MRRMIGLGVPTSVIAERLGLSVRTVEDYRAGLRAVMGLAPGSHGALDAALGRELGRQEGLDEARREAQAEVDRLKREVEALRAERDAAQAERESLRRALDAALAELERAREVLRNVEFSGRDSVGDRVFCPVCSGYIGTGHERDCALSAALAAKGE